MQPPQDSSDSVRSRDGALFLRPFEESDITERYLSWFRDDIATRYLEARNISAEDALGYLRSGKLERSRFTYAICAGDTGLHIGNVKIGDIDWKSSLSDLVTVIGDRDYWGKGIATSAIRTAIDIGFERHELRKFSAWIYSKNIGSLKAYTRAGFVVEAVLHGQRLGPDGVNDLIAVSCFNPKYFPTLPAFPLPLPGE